jgi:translation initiation factor 2 subunit 1
VPSTGYIDLSKRRVSPEDITKCEERYNKSRTVHSILRHVAEKTEIPLETLYETIGWPLNKRFGHALDAFRLSITNPDVWADVQAPSTAAMDELQSYIKTRLTPQPTKIRSDIEVTCFGYEGIDAIKKALKAAEQTTRPPPAGVAEDDTEIKVKLVAPPLYVLSCNTIDKNHGIALLEDAINTMTADIRASGGDCVVKMAPKAVDKTDDAELQALMEKRERENAEVSGDEDSGDADEGLELA